MSCSRSIQVPLSGPLSPRLHARVFARWHQPFGAAIRPGTRTPTTRSLLRGRKCSILRVCVHCLRECECRRRRCHGKSAAPSNSPSLAQGVASIADVRTGSPQGFARCSLAIILFAFTRVPSTVRGAAFGVAVALAMAMAMAMPWSW